MMLLSNGTSIDELRERKSGTRFSPVYQRISHGGETIEFIAVLAIRNCDLLSRKGLKKYLNNVKQKLMNSMLRSYPGMNKDMAQVQRQALAGLLWSKQYYHFDVERWLAGKRWHHTAEQQQNDGTQ